jgi:two-component system, OmpR family, sensor kinase
MAIRVPPERLTRHEISWLLAQEARGAAKALRTEVEVLRAPGDARITGAPPAETTLDALDDTIEMLSKLNTGSREKGRRGRIDLASLLVEVAPNARIAIAPGAGTEVFGEDTELRRMLHMLVGHASGRAPGEAEIEVTIRREGDFVRISANLGPDTSAMGELESRWLSRMALRHGGSVELGGQAHSILLQADGAIEQREVTELRKELEQAQQLGEAYARELASVLAAGDVRTEIPPPSRGDPEHFNGMRALAAAIQRALRGLHDNPAAVLEVLGELAALGECSLEAERSTVDLGATLRSVGASLEPHANRAEVAIVYDAGRNILLKTARQTLELLMRSLLLHAIAATPRGGRIRAAVHRTELGTVLSVCDQGPMVPEASRWDVIRHHIDPTRVGRPAGVALVIADATATALSAALELRESPDGHTETWVTLGKGS